MSSKIKLQKMEDTMIKIKKSKKAKITRLEKYVSKLPRNKYGCTCAYKYDYLPSPVMVIRHSVYQACGKCRRPLSVAASLEEARKVQRA